MKIEMRVLELVQRPPPPKPPTPPPLLQAAASKRLMLPTVKGGAFSTARRLEVAESQNVGNGANVSVRGAGSDERAVGQMDWGFGTSAAVPSYSFGIPSGPPPAGAAERRTRRSGVARAAAASAGDSDGVAAIAVGALDGGDSSDDDCSACGDDCCSACECLCHESLVIGASASAQEDEEARDGASDDECSACASDCCAACDCLCHEELATDAMATEDVADDRPAAGGASTRSRRKSRSTCSKRRRPPIQRTWTRCWERRCTWSRSKRICARQSKS